MQNHDAFHREAGFLPPDCIIRLLALDGFTKNTWSIPIKTAREIFKVLTPKNWKSLYQKGTFKKVDPKKKKDKKRSAIAAYHMHRAFLHEQVAINDAAGRVSGFDEKRHVMNVASFFRASTPSIAINRLVTESVGKQDEKYYKWVEPMQPAIRKRIEELTEGDIKLQSYTAKVREEALELFEELDDHVQMWRKTTSPNIRNYTEELAALGVRGRVNMSEFDSYAICMTTILTGVYF